MYPIEILKPRLRLRELGVADADALWRQTSVEDNVFFAPPGSHETLEAARADLLALETESRAPQRTRYRLGVEVRDTTELTGIVRIHIDGVYDRAGSIGYAFGRSWWGRGLATEAAEAMLGLAFDRLGLYRIEATIDPANQRSIRVAEKLGMTLEGRLRERFQTPGGARADSLVYSILQPEWRRR